MKMKMNAKIEDEGEILNNKKHQKKKVKKFLSLKIFIFLIL